MVTALHPGKAREENKEYGQYFAPALATPCGYHQSWGTRTEKEKKAREKERSREKREKKRVKGDDLLPFTVNLVIALHKLDFSHIS